MLLLNATRHTPSEARMIDLYARPHQSAVITAVDEVDACDREIIAPVGPANAALSLGVEFSLIMGAENSLVGALPGVPGRAPELPAFPSSPTMPADEVSDGGGDGGPAGRIDDDLGPSPPGIIGHGDRTPHGA